jgi:hypothetical protein
MGMTLIPAPTIEQTPVATRPQRLISLASVFCGSGIFEAIEKKVDPAAGGAVYRAGPP